MRYNPERTAWTVMTSAFIAFCLLVISIPVGAWQFGSTSDVTQEVTVTLISGTVFLTRPSTPLQGVVDTIKDVEEASRVDSDANAQGAISFYAPDQKLLLGSLQLYGSTRVKLVEMRSPRFVWWNPHPHQMTVELQRGRVRVNLSDSAARPITFFIRVGHHVIELNRAGSYSIEATDQVLDVIVREGAARVTANGAAAPLTTGQRGVVRGGQPPEQASTGERNLLSNSNFESPLTTDWTVYKDRFDPQDSDGKVERTKDDGRDTVSFYRAGFNWGRVSILQKVNREVRDYRSLRLHMALRISKQNLRSCGQYGSECPLMAKIEYTDVAGNKREWIQGFFFLADPSNALPMRCITCASSTTSHIRVQQDVWYLYDSPDLLTVFKNAGFTPAVINNISLYAEGHSFESFVSEVELLAGD